MVMKCCLKVPIQVLKDNHLFCLLRDVFMKPGTYIGKFRPQMDQKLGEFTQ